MWIRTFCLILVVAVGAKGATMMQEGQANIAMLDGPSVDELAVQPVPSLVVVCAMERDPLCLRVVGVVASAGAKMGGKIATGFADLDSSASDSIVLKRAGFGPPRPDSGSGGGEEPEDGEYGMYDEFDAFDAAGGGGGRITSGRNSRRGRRVEDGPGIVVVHSGVAMQYTGEYASDALIAHVIHVLERDSGAVKVPNRASLAALQKSVSSSAVFLAIHPEDAIVDRMTVASHLLGGSVGFGWTESGAVLAHLGLDEASEHLPVAVLVTPDRGVVPYLPEHGGHAQDVVDFIRSEDWAVFTVLTPENVRSRWAAVVSHDTAILWLDGSGSREAIQATLAVESATAEAYHPDADHPLRVYVIDTSALPQVASAVSLPVKLPALGIFQAGLVRSVWYEAESAGGFHHQGVSAFLSGYQRGEIKVNPLSQADPGPPGDSEPPVRVLTRNNIGRVLGNAANTNHVVVFTGNPSVCPGCVNILPIYDDLASQLASHAPLGDAVQLATYDVSQNDLPPGLSLSGYLPVFYMFPVRTPGEKLRAVSLTPQNGHVQDILVNFVRENADPGTVHALSSFVLENHDEAIARVQEERRAAAGVEQPEAPAAATA